jgi:hypothetical protein
MGPVVYDAESLVKQGWQMKIGAKQAALLSVREREIIQSSPPFQVKPLVALIKRSRDLRDKYRQLQQRQTIAAARSPNRKMSADNVRTAQKAELFDRALAHFESALHALNTESSAAARELKVTARSVARKPAAPGKTPPARKAASGPDKPVSSKARVAVPKKLAGASRGQLKSLASRRSRAKKS